MRNRELCLTSEILGCAMEKKDRLAVRIAAGIIVAGVILWHMVQWFTRPTHLSYRDVYAMVVPAESEADATRWCPLPPGDYRIESPRRWFHIHFDMDFHRRRTPTRTLRWTLEDGEVVACVGRAGEVYSVEAFAAVRESYLDWALRKVCPNRWF